jgi:hypothetical protein
VRRSRRGSAFWPRVLVSGVVSAALAATWALVWRLGWEAQVVAWPVGAGLLAWFNVWSRSRAKEGATPVPDAAELRAAELPASGRTAELAAAPPVRAAGSGTLLSGIRNSRPAGYWHPAGDPEADRRALLAGRAFRVVAYRMDSRR